MKTNVFWFRFYCYNIFDKFVPSRGSNWQQVNIGSDDGLAIAANRPVFLRDSPAFNSLSRLPDPASFCPGFEECPIKMNDSMFCSYFCSCNQKQRSVKPFDSQRFECGMIIGYLCMVINQQVPSWSGLKPINTVYFPFPTSGPIWKAWQTVHQVQAQPDCGPGPEIGTG